MFSFLPAALPSLFSFLATTSSLIAVAVDFLTTRTCLSYSDESAFELVDEDEDDEDELDYCVLRYFELIYMLRLKADAAVTGRYCEFALLEGLRRFMIVLIFKLLI